MQGLGQAQVENGGEKLGHGSGGMERLQRRKSRLPFPFLQQEWREDCQRGTISQGTPSLRGGHEPASGC